MSKNSYRDLLLSFMCACAGAYAQAASSSTAHDVIVFTDGEKLIGQLKSATGSSVTFHSDIAGDVTADWSKVQELHSAQKFAVIPKGVRLRKESDESSVPQGAVAVTDQKIQVTPATPATPQTTPVSNVANVVSEAALQQAFHHMSFFRRWTGGATAGISLTEATQKNQSFTGAVNLVRSVPGVDWLDERRRTIFNYTQAYGKLTQPGTPTVKTSLYHIDAEQDWYVSPRLFVFLGAAFDHSFSQGLKLQQTYGGGLGAVLIKTSTSELDFKASADYVDQRFDVSSQDQQLIGSVFSETYVEKLVHGIVLNEQAGITPSWNNTNAYSAFASGGLTFPVYHHFGFTVGAIDNFLNDPPPGFKKNSFQFTLGATYSLPAAQ